MAHFSSGFFSLVPVVLKFSGPLLKLERLSLITNAGTRGAPGPLGNKGPHGLVGNWAARASTGERWLLVGVLVGQSADAK